MCRAEVLSSSGVSRVQEEKLVSQALQGNGYPKSFIHKNTCPQPDQQTPRDQVSRGSVTHPYISGLSESIRRVLAPLAIHLPSVPIGPLGKSLCTPRTQHQPIGGNVWCTASHLLNAPSTYIDQTGRSLDHGLREHCRALKNGDLGSSALAEHVFSSNHRVDLSKTMVIDNHNHTQTRCMLD